MNEDWPGMVFVFGSAVLVFAAMFVIVLYRREHRRARLLRRIGGARHHFWF